MTEIFCRICLASDVIFVPLIKDSVEGVSLTDAGVMFEEHLNFNINELMKFSHICIDCHYKIDNFHYLKQKAMETYDVYLTQVKAEQEIMDEEIIEYAKYSFSENENDIFPTEYLEDYEAQIEDTEDTKKLDITILDNSSQLDSFPEADTPKIEQEDKKAVLQKKGIKYTCEFCKKKFRSEDSYTAHVNVHKGLPAYTCHQCAKAFKFKMSYIYHMKNHDNNRPFKCKQCGRGFICKWDLKIHFRLHQNERPYICDICGKSFRIHSHLTYHLETHNSENNYECPQCLQKYKTRATLKMHVTTIHTACKRFVCNICGHRFNRKYHLKVHARKHNKQ